MREENRSCSDSGAIVKIGISVATVDWKEEPLSVLETVDQLLDDSGLEIVIHNEGSDDSIVFSIQPRID